MRQGKLPGKPGVQRVGWRALPMTSQPRGERGSEVVSLITAQAVSASRASRRAPVNRHGHPRIASRSPAVCRTACISGAPRHRRAADRRHAAGQAGGAPGMSCRCSTAPPAMCHRSPRAAHSGPGLNSGIGPTIAGNENNSRTSSCRVSRPAVMVPTLSIPPPEAGGGDAVAPQIPPTFPGAPRSRTGNANEGSLRWNR